MTEWLNTITLEISKFCKPGLLPEPPSFFPPHLPTRPTPPTRPHPVDRERFASRATDSSLPPLGWFWAIAFCAECFSVFVYKMGRVILVANHLILEWVKWDQGETCFRVLGTWSVLEEFWLIHSNCHSLTRMDMVFLIQTLSLWFLYLNPSVTLPGTFPAHGSQHLIIAP